MGKVLVLAEKPSVGREIARVLKCGKKGNGYIEGDKYIVTWALGHLVTLADPEVYDDKYKTWKLEDLPMLPKHLKLVVIKQSGKQFSVVREQLNRKDVTDIVIATVMFIKDTLYKCSLYKNRIKDLKTREYNRIYSLVFLLMLN